MEKLLIGQSKNGTSKTKIAWTLGPESRSVATIEKLLKAGMNVARFNFSYSSHACHQETLDNLRTAMQNTGILCAVMLETKGPEIRTGLLKKGKPIELIRGQEITISVDYTIKGDSNIISMSYKKLAEHLKPGDVILCSDDGRISLTVLSCDKDLGLVRCRCENSAVLGEIEKVNLPGIVVDLPTLTDEDKKDILEWGVPNKVNIIAVSFVRKGSDLDGFRDLLGVHQKSIMLMSKIENEGVANVDEIMMRSDAVMVARRGLRMEMPQWMISRAQKRMIEKANALGKPIVTAIQMLEYSTSPHPTRAEATDLISSVLEGTDCVMLSGAIAVGAHHETVVQTMSRLCKEAEDSIDYRAVHKKIINAIGRRLPLRSRTERITVSAVTSHVRKTNAKAIIVVANSGFKAEMVAKYRPSVPVLSIHDLSAHDSAAHESFYYGIIPLMGLGLGALTSTEEKIRFGVQAARNEGICNVGDTVLALTSKIDGCPFIQPMVVD